MIPKAPILIVRENDHCVFSIGPVQYGVDQFHGVLLRTLYVGIAGMFIKQADRLYKRDTGQLTGSGGFQEIGLVFQMFFLCRCAIGIVGKIYERLVMEGERRIWPTREGAVPTSGIPGPGYALCRQPVRS